MMIDYLPRMTREVAEPGVKIRALGLELAARLVAIINLFSRILKCFHRFLSAPLNQFTNRVWAKCHSSLLRLNRVKHIWLHQVMSPAGER